MPGTRFLSYSGVFAYSPFRASINEERILDRIDSNRLLFFYESTLLGSYLSFSASLAWAEEPLNATHGSATAMQLYEVLGFSSVFGSIAWFSSRLADRAGGKNVLATAIIFFEESPSGYAVLWYVSVGAAVAPVATR